MIDRRNRRFLSDGVPPRTISRTLDTLESRARGTARLSRDFFARRAALAVAGIPAVRPAEKTVKRLRGKNREPTHVHTACRSFKSLRKPNPFLTFAPALFSRPTIETSP